MHDNKNRTLRFENLQKRELMAVDLAGGELRISGSASEDQIEISQEVRPTYVFQSGRIQRVTREMVRVDINGNSPRFFDASLVDRVFAEGLGGDDTIHNNTDLPSVIYGNDGDDILRGGTSEDTLVGGNDDDSLYGPAGRDLLSAGAENDGLFGGEDYDMVFGGSGTNRYLSNRDGDYLFRPNGDDAVIEFRTGSYTINRFGFFTGGSTFISECSNWPAPATPETSWQPLSQSFMKWVTSGTTHGRMVRSTSSGASVDGPPMENPTVDFAQGLKSMRTNRVGAGTAKGTSFAVLHIRAVSLSNNQIAEELAPVLRSRHRW